VIQHGDSSASSDLIAVKSDSMIYFYSNLVNLGDNRGFEPKIVRNDKHAIYTGIAISGDKLYATDMANRCIDVYDTNYQYLSTYQNLFVDSHLPNNYTPINIVPSSRSCSCSNRLYVTYGLLDISSGPDFNQLVKGHGRINLYTSGGTLKKHLGGHRHLDIPWGVVVLSYDQLLVMNHGSGRFVVYQDKESHIVRGVKLKDAWGIALGQSKCDLLVAFDHYVIGHLKSK
jgi:hypothetical protein